MGKHVKIPKTSSEQMKNILLKTVLKTSQNERKQRKKFKHCVLTLIC